MIQGRKEEEKYLKGNLFEGMLSVKAVCRSENGRKVLRAFFDESRLNKHAGDYGILLRLGEMHGFPVEIVPHEKIEEMTVGRTHGGVVAECSENAIPEMTEKDIVPGGFFFLVDGVEDPYNFGFVLRALYAAGVDAVLLTRRNWMTAAGTVCRSSAGASELLPLRVCDPSSAVMMLKNAGYRIVSSAMENAVPLAEAKLSRPLLMILGGEKRGVDREVLALSDQCVRIEYGRTDAPALSSVSASAILAYEAMRRIGPTEKTNGGKRNDL